MQLRCVEFTDGDISFVIEMTEKDDGITTAITCNVVSAEFDEGSVINIMKDTASIEVPSRVFTGLNPDDKEVILAKVHLALSADCASDEPPATTDELTFLKGLGCMPTGGYFASA